MAYILNRYDTRRIAVSVMYSFNNTFSTDMHVRSIMALLAGERVDYLTAKLIHVVFMKDRKY